MRRTILAAAAIAALAAAAPARADEWWLFSRTGYDVTYIDLASLNATDPARPTVWMRRFEPDMLRQMHGRPVFEFAEHWQADCAARRVTVLESQLFDRGGGEVGRSSATGRWIVPEIGTNAELLIQVLCDHNRVELDPSPAREPAALRALVLAQTPQ